MSLTSPNVPNWIGKDWLFAIVSGQVSGYEYVNKQGYIAAVGQTTTPIASAGIYQTPTALTSLEILSSSANDAAAGSGARTVTVTGLSTGWVEASETVTMNGVTPVALSTQFYRVYFMRVASSGTYATQAAPSHNSTITLRTAGAGATWATIIPDNSLGLGRSLIGAYTIPLGKTGYLLSDHSSIESGKTATIMRFFRLNANDTTASYSPLIIDDISKVVAGENSHSYVSEALDGPCDIGYMGYVAAGSAAIEIDFQLVLIDTPV